MKKTIFKLILLYFIVFALVIPHSAARADSFNPEYIISDDEMQNVGSWTASDIQSFLQNKGSYLAGLVTPDVTGVVKSAAQIIYDAALTYQINPKFLLVTLQKEESLVTDDSPTQRQLDWATGYGVCDGCSLNSPSVLKFKGFGKQVDNSAGIIRWYYNNSDTSFVKKKDQVTMIDNTSVVPQSWATAFLYTYTPHFSGNQNFWRIWNTWFSQIYPNGSLLKTSSSSDVWLIQNGVKRKFDNLATLMSMANPKMIITVTDDQLQNYKTGSDISFPNYSILRAPSGVYLLDYDTLRPFASAAVVGQIGYNPQEIVDVSDADIAGYNIGQVITATTTPQSVQGVIYQITDLSNAYYLFKDSKLYPIIDKSIIDTNYNNLSIEKHKLSEIKSYQVADIPPVFKDGTLFRVADSNIVYVIENGKKRRIADSDTFAAMGYKTENVITVQPTTAMAILNGDAIFLNGSLISSKNKYLGDSEISVDDVYGIKKSAAYLVAEYPIGRIVSGKNIDKKLPIASLVKLMTAYEALNQNYNLAKSTTYNKKKEGSIGTALALKDGAKLKNSDLFNAMLVGSGNNAAKMVAQTAGLSEKEMVADINGTLSDWGADDTAITDVTGLDKNNVSTARNLLKIFTKILEDKNIKNALSLTKYSFKELPSKAGASAHTVFNTNQLLTAKASKNYTILASKAGYTDEAGSVMVMLIQSKKSKTQYVVLTLGNKDTNNRFTEPDNLAKWISTGNVKITGN